MLQEDLRLIEGTVPGANDLVTESWWKQPVPRENSVVSVAMIPLALAGTVPVPGVAEQNAMLPCTDTPFDVQFQRAMTFPTSPPDLLQLTVHEYVDVAKAEGMTASAVIERIVIAYSNGRIFTCSFNKIEIII